MNKKDVVLKINTDTSAERKLIEIDNVKYELASPDDMSFKEYVWIENAGKTIAKGLDGNPSEQRVEKAVTLINQTIKKIVLSLPDTVARKLSDRQKMNIIITWGEERQLLIPGAIPEEKSVKQDG